MKILFHDNQLSYRGTSNAMFDYAFYSREILGHEPVITYQKNNDNNFAPAIKRFCNNFEVIPYQNAQELKNIIKNEQIDLFYKITGGKKENLGIDIKTAIHAVFKHYEPYGDVYAYVSKWLSLEMSQGQLPFVPHIIHLPDHQADLRAELGIPKDAIVFGQYGGAESFDIKFVQKTIKHLSRKRKDLFFLFMGTNPFAKANLFLNIKISYFYQLMLILCIKLLLSIPVTLLFMPDIEARHLVSPLGSFPQKINPLLLLEILKKRIIYKY